LVKSAVKRFGGGRYSYQQCRHRVLGTCGRLRPP
jgi:hypothetical protein